MLFSDTESEDGKTFKLHFNYVDCQKDDNSIDEDNKQLIGGNSGHSSCKNMTNKYQFNSFLGSNGQQLEISRSNTL